MSLPPVIEAALAALNSGDYESIEEHHGGANGYLFFATNKVSKTDVAIKFYYGEPGDRRHDEPRLLAQINSPFVLPLLGAHDVDHEWAYFVTARCHEGDLDRLIDSKPSAMRAVDVALGLATGCSALHAVRLIHRDLKPANVVLDNGAPRIADFGSVRRLVDGATSVTASQHSVLYRPPESFDTGQYTTQGDVYQVGLTTFQLMGGHLSYDGVNYLSAAQRKTLAAITDPYDQSRYIDDAIASRAKRGKLLDMSTLPPWTKARAKTAIRRMTNPDPAERIADMAGVVAELTAVRAATTDWCWRDGVACLTKGDRRIEVRPAGPGTYTPLQTTGGNFRRIPGMPDGTLAALVRAIDG